MEIKWITLMTHLRAWIRKGDPFYNNSGLAVIMSNEASQTHVIWS